MAPMAEQQTPKATHAAIRAVVDYGGLAAWLGAFLVYWQMMGMDRSEALLEATWWLVGGSAVSLLVGWFAERRIAPIPLFAGLVALVFGTMALVFHDARFIKIKPTVTNLCFAVLMLGGVAMGKNPLKALFSGSMNLSQAAWRTLTIRYGVFFLGMAGLNELVWRTQPDQIWVFFKFPGMEILILFFAATQVPMMMKDMKAVETAAELEI
jgi:intracellular septation protein